MPHSPYRKTVYEPIRNIDEYRNDLSRHRASWEDGERDKYRDEMLLDIGDSLMEQCDFLEGKLGIKKHELIQFAERNNTLENENKALKEESRAQLDEIAALKSELEKTKAAAGNEGQLGLNDHGISAEVREAEKPGEGEGSLETAETATSQKRSAESDAAIDGRDVKK